MRHHAGCGKLLGRPSGPIYEFIDFADEFIDFALQKKEFF
jgi:hypothetical protein